MSFDILVVCTGNICRSPLAGLLLRRGLDDRLGAVAHGFEVASAGTWGLENHPMDDATLAVASCMGLDGSGFRSRRLTEDHLAVPDLVLTATREHRTAVGHDGSATAPPLVHPA